MIEIAPFTPDYNEETAQFVISMLEGEFGYGPLERPDLRDISAFYQGEKSNFWLALEDGKVVGTVGFKNYGQGRAHLKRMYVKEKLRRQSLGEQLFRTLLEFAKDNSYKTIYATTMTQFSSGRSFYQKNGFVEIEKLPTDLPDFDDDIFLKLEL